MFTKRLTVPQGFKGEVLKLIGGHVEVLRERIPVFIVSGEKYCIFTYIEVI